LKGHLQEFTDNAGLGVVPDEYADSFLNALFANDVDGDRSLSWGEYFNQIKMLAVAAN